jgi:hypothetical protein
MTALVLVSRSSTSHTVHVEGLAGDKPDDKSKPHLGDGICAPSTNPVYAGQPGKSPFIRASDENNGNESVEAPDPADVPHMTEQQAMDAARSLMAPLPPTVKIGAYFARVSYLFAGHGGPSGPLVRRPAWVVEISQWDWPSPTSPPPSTDQSQDGRTNGATTGTGRPGQHLLEVIDDATGAELWAEFCP